MPKSNQSQWFPKVSPKVLRKILPLLIRHELERTGTAVSYCGPQWQTLSKIGVSTEDKGPRNEKWTLILIIPFEPLYLAIPKATM